MIFTYEFGKQLVAQGFKFDVILGDDEAWAVGMNTPTGARYCGKTAGDAYRTYLLDVQRNNGDTPSSTT